MILTDAKLTTKEEIQDRINSIQKQLDKENNSSTRSHNISAKIAKREKIEKLNSRQNQLVIRLRELKKAI